MKTEKPALPPDGSGPGLAPAPPRPAAPVLRTVLDQGDGKAGLRWENPASEPAQLWGFAWDIYAGDWVRRGPNGTPWFPFPAASESGSLDLGLSGAYHVWLSAYYADGAWLPCHNPWTGAIHSGSPHTPLSVNAAVTGPRRLRLHWKPDLYGAWHYQIAAYKTDVGWVETGGPDGTGLWHFVDYSRHRLDGRAADFKEGWADFVLPAPGSYWLFVRAAGWQPPHPCGEFAKTFATVAP